MHSSILLENQRPHYSARIDYGWLCRECKLDPSYNSKVECIAACKKHDEESHKKKPTSSLRRVMHGTGMIIRASVSSWIPGGSINDSFMGVIEYKTESGIVLRVVDDSIKYKIKPLIPRYIKVLIPSNQYQYCDKTEGSRIVIRTKLDHESKVELGYLWMTGNIHQTTMEGYL